MCLSALCWWWATLRVAGPGEGHAALSRPGWNGRPGPAHARPLPCPTLPQPSPVIDISPGVDVPALDGCPHALLHLLPLGLTDAPGLRPIKHDVGEDATGVVGNLNPIGLALEEVAAKMKEKCNPVPQVPLQIVAAGPLLANQMPEVLLISLLLKMPTQMTSERDLGLLKVRYSYKRTI